MQRLKAQEWTASPWEHFADRSRCFLFKPLKTNPRNWYFHEVTVRCVVRDDTLVFLPWAPARGMSHAGVSTRDEAIAVSEQNMEVLMGTRSIDRPKGAVAA